jgi:hypothetical protein
MGDAKDAETEEPSLELPSLFRRRKKPEPAPDESAPGPETTPVGSVEPPRRVRPIEPRVGAPRARDDDPERAPAVPLPDRVRAGIPEMAASTAALVVGALVGLLGCLATWVGLQGCEAVTGAQTCGGPGLLLLVAIVVGQVVLGAVLLKVVGVPEAGNVSLIGVGLMVVVALLVLVDHLYDAWMFLAIPVVTAATFGVGRWITTRYADDTDDYPAQQHDIR